ncbi:GNAT family N-acetyltransferase [Variovorax terrae]|uniref:GNAT family N-acetyltransferase n=1 Tax=Variovorax terrae TaxID=2923278 RepID=A0A9X1VUI6_9BURK|nr:GNAT family N-acetyltransferase [Variovorax terrae]MCJ0763524.1 GNAT family N-acetyltransferase [Variovorax terrae]
MNTASPPELVPVGDAATRDAARRLIADYLAWVAAEARTHYGLSFDTEAMLASDLGDPTKFYPPNGRFYLVRHAGRYVGVGCLKRLPDPSTGATAELQRMYVEPAARGLGAGRLLVQRLLADARAMGCRQAKLESLKCLSAAHGLYRSAGFTEVQPYAGNSMQDYQAGSAAATYRASAVFMELDL